MYEHVTDLPGNVDVKGRVLNENGELMAGVSVSIKNSRTGMMTDLDGLFQFSNVDEDAVLVFSGANIETLEERINGRKEIVVIVRSKISKLDEVQVIAYGTVSKRLNTGDVSTIKSETISQQVVSNPLAAIEGRVPGLAITQNTGIPGGAFSVQIRGQNSIQNGNNPLYIIDGVPFPSTSISSQALNILITGGGDPLSSINPDEIESISILKDADATAIYGSRGANGVIIITTKHGTTEKTRFDLNMNSGAGSVTRTMNLLNTGQYLEMRHEAFKNDGATPGPRDRDVNGVWDTTRYTNWEKTLIGGTAYQTDLHATLSGGNHQTQFVFGSNFRQETTVFGHNFKDQKESGYINLNHHSANDKLSVRLSANYNAENNSLPNYDVTPQVFRLPPDAPPIFDSSGNLNWEKGTFNNPFSLFKRSYQAKTENFISNLLLEYQIVKGLHLIANLGYSKMEVSEISSDPTTSINPAYGFTSGFSYFSDQTLLSWIVEPQLEYVSACNAGTFKILVGSTLQNNLTQGQVLYANGFTSDLLLQDIGNASSITQQGTTYSLYRYSAAFGRINYNWKDEYLLNLTARRDGSSRFGPGRQFANFGAAGAAWIFTRKPGIRKLLPLLSFGKLRASYGITGNDQIGDYQYISTWTSSYYPYGNIAGIFPVNLSNPNYGWEVNRKLEVGTDLSFWRDRLTLSAAYYVNHSSNQLVNNPLPSITGFTSIQSNLPATVRNSGWEFEVGSTNLKNKHFTWSTSLNLTIPRNKLVAFPGIRGSAYQNLYGIGKPLSIYKSFHYTGVDPKTGAYTFEDVDKDGSISYPNDILPTKSVSQEFYGGVENDIRFKGFQVNILFQFVKQTGRNYSYYYPGVPGSAINQPDLVLSRWQKPGDEASIQQFTQSYSSTAYESFSNYRMSDNTIGDASFIRLKTLSISYQLPLKQKAGSTVQRIRIYLQGQNLLTITHYLGMDPENQTINALPPLRMLVAGLQIIL
jgi:TonB-linked SusC/RagA family outer membrane protein